MPAHFGGCASPRYLRAAYPPSGHGVYAGAPEATPPPPLAAEPARPLPTLVFFIGGCTFAELAAVRWLGRHESPPREYIVATTHLCSGDDLVRSLITSLENNLTRL